MAMMDGFEQNAKASSHHSHSQITPLEKIPERSHFKVLSVTYNSLQHSQPFYLRELFTTQPTRSIRSSSCLTIYRHPITSILSLSSPTEPRPSVTAPRL